MISAEFRWARTGCLALAAAIAASGAAMAQQATDPAAEEAPETAATGSGDTLIADEILVFGTKIKRTFLDTPTSVGIVTADDIDDYALTNTFDSFNQLANVRRLNTNGGSDSFQIRGLSADGIADIANPATLISVIIDGATQNFEGLRRGARSTWDLEQVEVLRGPQSGLYGRAALGGAVVLKSKDPTYHYEGGARLSFGTVEALGASFAASGPLIEDQLALRISGDVQRESTDITIIDPLNDFFGEDDFRNLRGKLLFEPKAIPDLRVLLTANHSFDRTATPLVNAPFGDRILSTPGFASEGRQTTVTNYIADISYDLTDTLTLRSISAFIDTDAEIFGAPGSTVFFRDDLRDGKDFTQDLALEIDDSDGTGLSGVVGFFYGDFTQDIETDIQVDLGAFTTGTPNGIIIPFQTGTSSAETRSIAVYADLRYNFYGPFSLLAGLRYQHDRVRNANNTVDALTGPSIFDIEAEFDVFLPKAGLAFDIDDTQSIAATASRGYRQGFTENIVGTTLQNDVDPEFVWTYELAYRYQNNGITFGANAFFNDYTDQQVTIINQNFLPFNNTFNVGSSRSYGVEFEGRYDNGNGLSIFAALGLLKTEIETLRDPNLANNICGASGGDCAGNEFPEAPSVTAALGGIYRHDSGFYGTADLSYTGSYFSGNDINNTAAREIGSIFLVNAGVGYETENFQAQFYVKNLLGNNFVTDINSTLTGAAVGEGRTFGAELTVRF